MGSRNLQKWHTLTSDQRRSLRKAVEELCGDNISFSRFAEQALILIEDVAGLETLSESQLTRLINELWRDDDGKAKGKSRKNR